MALDAVPGNSRVIFQPATYQAMCRGVGLLVDAIRPTLGPRPRFTAIERTDRNRTPEILDDGALIARRIVGLTDRDADMAAMFTRQMLWTLREKTGDGSATAAILFHAIFTRGVEYVVSGGNAARLRVHLEKALGVILEELAALAVPIGGSEPLARMADMVCFNQPMAAMLGEIVDIVGPHGDVDLRSSYGTSLRREYIRGTHWQAGLFSPERFIPPGATRADLSEPSILVSDLAIETAEELAALLEVAVQAQARSLAVIASGFSDQALAMMHVASQHARGFPILPIKIPEGSADDLPTTLTEMTVLLGGLPLVRAAGDSLYSVRPHNLGRARSAWADRFHFGTVGGGGDVRQLREHLERLRSAHQSADRVDERNRLRQRIGRLTGGSATLWIEGTTETETRVRMDTATRAVETLRAALSGGVVPGGGTCLLACRDALRARQQTAQEADERAAYSILAQALESPIRALLSNAGVRPGAVLAGLHAAGPGHAFDVVRGSIVRVQEARLYDPYAVQAAAVFSAVSSAATALTVDVLVHHKKPQQAMTP